MCVASFSVMVGLQSCSGKNLIPDPEDLSSLLFYSLASPLNSLVLHFLHGKNRIDPIIMLGAFSSSPSSPSYPSSSLSSPSPSVYSKGAALLGGALLLSEARGTFRPGDNGAGARALPNNDRPAGQKWALGLLDLIFFFFTNLFLGKFIEGL